MDIAVTVAVLVAHVQILKAELQASSGYVLNSDLQIRCGILRKQIELLESEISKYLL